MYTLKANKTIKKYRAKDDVSLINKLSKRFNKIKDQCFFPKSFYESL